MSTPTYYAEQKARGLKIVKGWVAAEDVQKVQRYIRKLREEYLDSLKAKRR